MNTCKLLFALGCALRWDGGATRQRSDAGLCVAPGPWGAPQVTPDRAPPTDPTAPVLSNPHPGQGNRHVARRDGFEDRTIEVRWGGVSGSGPSHKPPRRVQGARLTSAAQHFRWIRSSMPQWVCKKIKYTQIHDCQLEGAGVFIYIYFILFHFSFFQFHIVASIFCFHFPFSSISNCVSIIFLFDLLELFQENLFFLAFSLGFHIVYILRSLVSSFAFFLPLFVLFFEGSFCAPPSALQA